MLCDWCVGYHSAIGDFARINRDTFSRARDESAQAQLLSDIVFNGAAGCEGDELHVRLKLAELAITLAAKARAWDLVAKIATWRFQFEFVLSNKESLFLVELGASLLAEGNRPEGIERLQEAVSKLADSYPRDTISDLGHVARYADQFGVADELLSTIAEKAERARRRRKFTSRKPVNQAKDIGELRQLLHELRGQF